AILAQPVSRESIEKEPRIRRADKAVASVCPYCAVGCSQLIYVKDKRIIDIEGNPASPINERTLCPKGAATYQYVVNPNRVTTVRYRAPLRSLGRPATRVGDGPRRHPHPRDTRRQLRRAHARRQAGQPDDGDCDP